MLKNISKGLRTIGALVSALFINGLLAILPLTITIVILHFVYKIIKAWVDPIHEFVMQHPAVAQFPIPYIEVIAIILLIFAIGAFLNLFLMRSLFHKTEKLIGKLPLVRALYSGIKQLTNALGTQDKDSFKQVVFVEFPKKGVYSIGFLTCQMAPHLAPSEDKAFYNIFIPTTPNPTSGFFLVVEKSDIRPTPLTRQEAMALIISGGIIQPERCIDPEKELLKKN